MPREIAQALEIVQRRDPAAIEDALALLQRVVFAFSMKLCGQREDAQDTTQETLLVTVPYLHRFDSPDALAVWLYKVARSRCLMSRRESKFAPRAWAPLEEAERKPDTPAVTRPRDGATPEKRLLGQERRRHLQRAVLKLPHSYRLPLVLHDMEGLSTRQTAEILGIKEGTVRVRLHRARLFLRDELAGSLAGAPRGTPPTRSASSARCKKLVAECSDYLDARLDEAVCDRIRTHVAGCAPCRAFLATMQATIDQCRAHRPGGPRPRLTARMRRLLLEDYRRAVRSLNARAED